MNKKRNIDDVFFAIEVDEDNINDVRSKSEGSISVELNEDSMNLILENVDGHLIVREECMPETFHSCYYYNGGDFPYLIKQSLKFLLLVNGKDRCLTSIRKIETVPSVRFRFQDEGEPSVEDPDGDSCIWKVRFDVKTASEREFEGYVKNNVSGHEPKTYLLRWNPSISSFSLDTYREATTKCPDGFGMDWSIYEWEDAKEGDEYFMLRTGDDRAGIVFCGSFRSAPYSGEDWAGRGKPRKYVDISCECCAGPDDAPWVSVEKLTAAIPEINWTRGHSGELLPADVAARLHKLWTEGIYR